MQGSTGQPRPNPLYGELRRQRELADRLVRSLAVPSDGTSRRAARLTGKAFGMARSLAALLLSWHRVKVAVRQFLSETPAGAIECLALELIDIVLGDSDAFDGPPVHIAVTIAIAKKDQIATLNG